MRYINVILQLSHIAFFAVKYDRIVIYDIFESSREY